MDEYNSKKDETVDGIIGKNRFSWLQILSCKYGTPFRRDPYIGKASFSKVVFK